MPPSRGHANCLMSCKGTNEMNPAGTMVKSSSFTAKGQHLALFQRKANGFDGFSLAVARRNERTQAARQPGSTFARPERFGQAAHFDDRHLFPFSKDNKQKNRGVSLSLTPLFRLRYWYTGVQVMCIYNCAEGSDRPTGTTISIRWATITIKVQVVEACCICFYISLFINRSRTIVLQRRVLLQ
jgi:hypothetical protein